MNTNYDQHVFEALLRSHLSSFIAKAFQVVSPGDEFVANWHIDVVADALEQSYRREIKRLAVTMPPRSLKSIAASIAFPAWALGLDPTLRIICASYSSELAAKFARDCRAVMESSWYRQTFPGTRLVRSAELNLETTRKGGRIATSVGGTLTGLGGNIIIIDDAMKPLEAFSDLKREGVNQWYANTVHSRLDNKAEGVIILVMQRLHVHDLTAFLQETDSCTQIDLPAGQISGLVDARAHLQNIEDVAFVELKASDIVRHPVVSRIVAAYAANPHANTRR